MLARLFSLLIAATLTVHAKPKTYDFEFRDMDLKRVLSSLAKLQDKSVIFSRAVETKPVDLSLSDVTADYAMKLVAENYGYVVVDRKAGILHVMTAIERGPASTDTTVIPLRHVVARDIVDNIRAYMGAQGTLSINEQRNVFIINGAEEMILRVKKLVQELDREALQVFIQAKVIESDTTFARSLGIQWGPQLAQNTTSGGTVTTPTGTSTTNGLSLNAPVGENALTATLTNFASLQAQIMMGERTGKLKILSSPRITTMNGVSASIESVTTFNIKTLAATGAGAAAVGGLAQVTAGVTLRVTPNVVSKDKVRLQISLSKSDADSSKIDGIPGISSNNAQTSLIVDSGQTASIGGLIRHAKTENHNGIPFLSSLPILGALFSNTEKTSDDREVLIFLTPTIYGDLEEVDADRSAASEELPSETTRLFSGPKWEAPAPTAPAARATTSAPTAAAPTANGAPAPAAAVAPPPTTTGGTIPLNDDLLKPELASPASLLPAMSLDPKAK